MSKSQSKGQNMKSRNPSDSSTNVESGNDTLDANQSAQAMSAGEDDTSFNQGKSGDAVSAVDEEGSKKSFGEPETLESGSTSTSVPSGSLSSKVSEEAGNLLSKASSAMEGLDTQAVKKNLNLVKHKAQDLLSSSREQLSSKYATLSDDVKLRGMMVDDKVKASPYAYALGAAGIGFILGRALSGKGKQDLDFLMSTVNKLNLTTLAGMVGMKVEDNASAGADEATTKAKTGYNEKQARKIG